MGFDTVSESRQRHPEYWISFTYLLLVFSLHLYVPDYLDKKQKRKETEAKSGKEGKEKEGKDENKQRKEHKVKSKPAAAEQQRIYGGLAAIIQRP